MASLLLLLDGESFDGVLTFETSLVKNEQYFPLDEPVLARFARLLVNVTFEKSTANRLMTAGWKDLTPRAYYELQAGLQPEASLLPADNDVKEHAAALDFGARAYGQVSRGCLHIAIANF